MIYDYFYEFTSEALHSFEIFIKSNCYCSAKKIPDDVTATTYTYILANEKIGNRKFVNNAENSFIVHPV